MKENTFSVRAKFIFASTCGAIIGTFVGLQFIDSLWWLLGIPTGGFVGWFLADPTKFFKMIPVAFQGSIQGLRNFWYSVLLVLKFPGFLWRDTKLNWKLSFMATCICSNLFLFLFACISLQEPKANWTIALIFYFPVMFLGSAIFSSLLNLLSDREKQINYPKAVVPMKFSKNDLRIAYKSLPPIWMILLLVWVLRKVWEGGGELVRGVRRLFILTYSELVFACMANAVAGTVVGSFFENIFMGGISGASLGILSFVIFDSVKKLRLNKKVV